MVIETFLPAPLAPPDAGADADPPPLVLALPGLPLAQAARNAPAAIAPPAARNERRLDSFFISALHSGVEHDAGTRRPTNLDVVPDAERGELVRSALNDELPVFSGQVDHDTHARALEGAV